MIIQRVWFPSFIHAKTIVQTDVRAWGKWVSKELNLKGIRFDAVKHYSEGFLQSFIENLDAIAGNNWFLVGEFWKESLEALTGFLQRLDHKFSLFDCILVDKFSEISNAEEADLRSVFDGTLVCLHDPRTYLLIFQGKN
jgi:alpha-amylase